MEMRGMRSLERETAVMVALSVSTARSTASSKRRVFIKLPFAIRSVLWCGLPSPHVSLLML
jgi:hypothetical protein